MSLKKEKVCIPGERLVQCGTEYKSGPGTYVTHGFIYASLAGFLFISQQEQGQPALVEVKRPDSESTSVPFVGAIVTAKVLNMGPRFCKCSILCVNDSVLAHSFNAQIRKEDVRQHEIDKVEMSKMFRPGDIILARVVNLDSQSSYLLSTAEAELGVVSARCEDGHKLRAVSWTQMQCDVSGDLENRKVAIVPQLNNEQTNSNLST